MLVSFCVSTFGSTPQGLADPRPLIPPLATCHNYGVCPSRAAACIGMPYIPACDPAMDGGAAGPAWNLTLQEAINAALSNSEAVRNLGLVEAASRNDIVRSLITSYDPLEADAKAASEWGIFDPLWTTEMLWDKQDVPPGTSFSGIGNRPPQLDTADAYTSLEQLLPMGAKVRADIVTNYLFNPQKPAGLDPNPQYFSYNQVGITQPLLRGFGVEVTMAPIKIAAAEAERTDWQFKQEMLALVRSIETTYWGLYAQQQNLKAIEQVIPHFREVVRLRQEQAGNAVGAESEVARAQSEMYLFEQRRLDTLSKVAEQALVLRNLMGLPPEDCRDIVPLAVPSTTRPFESLQQAVDTAVNSRPDVLRQRLAVYVASQERLLADNALKPQLDLNGFYRVNGLGENLDESWESKDSNNFDSWNMGVFFQIPLGRRQGRAELRAAEYRMSRERAMLQQTAHQASYEVADAYRRINWVYQQLQVAANRQQALNQWSQGAKAQFDSPPPGMTTVFALELYLQNLRDITDASISANALLADYNSALARLEEVKGTLLENRMVAVAGDTSDSLPAQLPAPEIQLPESVQPAPAEPAPQPAPEGAMVLPPIEAPVVIAREPQPAPQPVIELPESIQSVPNAYAELPATPAPQPLAEPAVEAPVEIAQEIPPPAPQPLPPITPTPSMAMPPSMLPEPAYTAMRPAPLELPQAVEEPFVEQPLVAPPIVETPAIEEPTMEEPAVTAPAPEIVREIPRSYSPQPAPTLAMPESMLPTPAPTVETPRPMKPQAALQMPNSSKPAPQSQLAGDTPEQPATPTTNASLQLPKSVLSQPAPEQASVPTGPLKLYTGEAVTPAQPLSVSSAQAPAPASAATGISRYATAAPMQFPPSIRSVTAAPAAAPIAATAETRSKQAARPLPAAQGATKAAPRGQAVPQLQMPNSVRPAAAQAPVDASPQMAFPGSVGTVNR